MNGTQWIIFILIIQVIHFLGTWKLYVKAGRKAWEAAIPIYNAIVLMQIINQAKMVGDFTIYSHHQFINVSGHLG